MAESSSWSFDEADLSACFDDTMNSIGAGVGSMFNMRDALSALPLCNDESKISKDSKDGGGSKFHMSDNSDQTVATIFVSMADTNSHLFDNILKAPTSSATRLGEASLTYLNRGQTYELKLNSKTPEITFIKTWIRVTFYDKQMELNEREHWNNWHQTHPGENLLDIDYEKSNDYEELDMENTPSDDVLCIWKYPKCTIGLRFNCVSTEFTAKKHGGEKGIPFRFQVEHFEYDTNQHLGSFACQIKVFKMKGADRKHKTDRERIERKSGDGQTIYKPSVPVTKLSYLPNKQVKLYHSNHHHKDHNQYPSINDHEPIDSTFKVQSTNVADARIPTTTSIAISSSQKFELNVNDSSLQNSAREKQLNDVNDTSSNFVLLNPVESPSPVANRSFSEFVTPTYPFQRSALRNLSPGISPSPSSNRRLNCTIQPSFQRRRRLRLGDCCVGSCSSCGRSCRSASRWVRCNKNRMMCANWDNSTNRTKQASLVSERRRAAHGCENNSHLTELSKSKSVYVNIPSHQSTSTNNSHPAIYELSTSGESSSLGNDEFNKFTILDKYDDKRRSSSVILPDYSLNSVLVTAIQSNQDPLLGMSSATPASRDTGYCSSDLLTASPLPSVEDRVIEQIGYCAANDDNNNNNPPLHERDDDDGELLKFEELYMDKFNSVAVHQATSCDTSIVAFPNKHKVEMASLPLSTTTPTARVLQNSSSSTACSSADVAKPPITSNISSIVHAEMTASQVTKWLHQSNFENLVETFKNFTGCDILRLTKEDLLSVCGSLEGLRLYNSLYNKPVVPRCTLYVCLKGDIIYHAVMLYEMNVHELRCRIASILSCRHECLKVICLITEHDIPVLLSDELIIQLKDKSTYQIILNRVCGNKMNLFLKPIQ
ncbi:Upstream-binding protein 1 [Schistosoma japonicum]|nr:Upstream-binding protein 1 [Schistosoma japonicum]KAH8876526.1 Upstream-binding protein 1 [Schistosoma japonicum]